jgi:hypothetical protein
MPRATAACVPDNDIATEGGTDGDGTVGCRGWSSDVMHMRYEQYLIHRRQPRHADSKGGRIHPPRIQIRQLFVYWLKSIRTVLLHTAQLWQSIHWRRYVGDLDSSACQWPGVASFVVPAALN